MFSMMNMIYQGYYKQPKVVSEKLRFFEINNFFINKKERMKQIQEILMKKEISKMKMLQLIFKQY